MEITLDAATNFDELDHAIGVAIERVPTDPTREDAVTAARVVEHLTAARANLTEAWA